MDALAILSQNFNEETIPLTEEALRKEIDINAGLGRNLLAIVVYGEDKKFFLLADFKKGLEG